MSKKKKKGLKQLKNKTKHYATFLSESKFPKMATRTQETKVSVVRYCNHLNLLLRVIHIAPESLKVNVKLLFDK